MTTERTGPLDTLVLNAGIASLDADSLEDTDLADVQELIQVNTMGVLHGLTLMPPFLRDGASVIITASAATNWAFPGYMGIQPLEGPALRDGSSRGDEARLARHQGEHVSPGTVLTPMQPADDPEARIARVATCLGRPAFPDEVAGVYVFLASDDSAYVTATDIRADGGWLDGLTEAHAEALLAGIEDTTHSPSRNTAGQSR